MKYEINILKLLALLEYVVVVVVGIHCSLSQNIYRVAVKVGLMPTVSEVAVVIVLFSNHCSLC